MNRYRDQVENEEWLPVSVCDFEADIFERVTEDGVTTSELEAVYIPLIKDDAHKLAPEIPLANANYSANYGTYEPTYSDHTGVDFIGGYEVYTSHSGTVKFTVTGIGKTAVASYGNHISINNSNNTFMYCHLENSSNGVLVFRDNFILVGKKLEQIGTKGALSGFGSGPHLHYEVRPIDGRYLSDVDPYNFLPKSLQSQKTYL